MKRWIFLIALGVAGGLIFRKVAFEGIYIATPSMEPTLPVGANYIVNKWIFLFRDPRRGEIVVIESPVEEDKDVVKRVVALPGETVSVKDKAVFVDEKPLDELYAKYERKEEILEGDNMAPMKIPADSFFVLGDNRDNSKDSISWKDPRTGEHIYFVKKEKIKGVLMNVLE